MDNPVQVYMCRGVHVRTYYMRVHCSYMYLYTCRYHTVYLQLNICIYVFWLFTSSPPLLHPLCYTILCRAVLCCVCVCVPAGMALHQSQKTLQEEVRELWHSSHGIFEGVQQLLVIM